MKQESSLPCEQVSPAEETELTELLAWYVEKNHAVVRYNGAELRERRGQPLSRQPLSLLQRRYAETRLHGAVLELVALARRRTALLLLRTVRYCEVNAPSSGSWQLPDANYFGRSPATRVDTGDVVEVVDLTAEEADHAAVETLILDGPLASTWALPAGGLRAPPVKVEAVAATVVPQKRKRRARGEGKAKPAKPHWEGLSESLGRTHMGELRTVLEGRFGCSAGALRHRTPLLEAALDLFLRQAQAAEAAGRPRPVVRVDLTREAEVVVLDG